MNEDPKSSGTHPRRTEDGRPGAAAPRFLRLSIAAKMLLGYLPLAVLITATAGFGLSELGRLIRINSGIVRTDSPLIEAMEELSETLLAQEQYGRRFLILRSPDVLELFRKKSAEADGWIRQIAFLDAPRNPTVGEISRAHAAYDQGFARLFQEARLGAPALVDQEDPTRQEYLRLIDLIGEASSSYRARRNERARLAAEVSARAFRVMSVLCVLGLILGVGSALLITRSISGPIHKLKLATDRIAQGDFEPLPSLGAHDELGDLSRAFSEMARELKRLETLLLDANPLTRLPGGTAIESILRQKLEAGEPLAFCVLDLDNFKPFSDAYGYPRGSEVIKAVGHIVKEAVETGGTEDDFVGHVGGDDFVLLTRPDRYEGLCRRIIEAFDRMIPKFYEEEDRRRGYIVGRTRQGQIMNFPIMSISIAVVTNQRQRLTSDLQVGEIAAELKEYAKSLPGSVFVADRRSVPRWKFSPT